MSALNLELFDQLMSRLVIGLLPLPLTWIFDAQEGEDCQSWQSIRSHFEEKSKVSLSDREIFSQAWDLFFDRLEVKNGVRDVLCYGERIVIEFGPEGGTVKERRSAKDYTHPE